MTFFSILLAISSLASASEPLFCTDPYQAICVDPTTPLTLPQRAEANIQKMRSTIDREGAMAFFRVHPLPSSAEPTDADIEALLLRMKDFTTDIVEYKEFGRLKKEARDRIIAPLMEEGLRDARRIRDFYSTLGILGALPASMQSEIAGIIRLIEPVSEGDITRLAAGNPDLHMLFSLIYATDCGNDGMQQQASTLPAIPNMTPPLFFLCPGVLAAQGKVNPQSDALLVSILQTSAHEMAHHFDSKKFPDLYRNYRSCLIENYAGDLAADPLNPQSATPATKVDSHLAEITADLWSVRVGAAYLQTLESASSKTEFLRRAWGGMCNETVARDEGIHPSGRFRIENLLAKDPDVRSLMGCTPSTQPQVTSGPSRPACSL